MRKLKVWLPIDLSDEKFWPGEKTIGTDVNILTTCSVSLYSEEELTTQRRSVVHSPW